MTNDLILKMTQPWFKRANSMPDYLGMQIFKTDIVDGNFAGKYYEHTLIIARALLFSLPHNDTPPRRMQGYQHRFRSLPPEIDDRKCGIVYFVDRFYKLVKVDENMYGHSMFFIISELKLDFRE